MLLRWEVSVSMAAGRSKQKEGLGEFESGMMAYVWDVVRWMIVFFWGGLRQNPSGGS